MKKLGFSLRLHRFYADFAPCFCGLFLRSAVVVDNLPGGAVTGQSDVFEPYILRVVEDHGRAKVGVGQREPHVFQAQSPHVAHVKSP